MAEPELPEDSPPPIVVDPDKNFVYVQDTPSAQWIIQHGLGKFPSIEIVDSNGDEVDGDVQYLDTNFVTVTFVGAFSGKAFLN